MDDDYDVSIDEDDFSPSIKCIELFFRYQLTDERDKNRKINDLHRNITIY